MIVALKIPLVKPRRRWFPSTEFADQRGRAQISDFLLETSACPSARNLASLTR